MCFAGPDAYLLDLDLETTLDRETPFTPHRHRRLHDFFIAHRSAANRFDSPARSCDLDALVGRLRRGFALCFEPDAKFGGTWRHMAAHKGYYIRDRLVDIQSVSWSRNPRHNQLAVHIIVYALTQEGSITQRLMQMVN